MTTSTADQAVEARGTTGASLPGVAASAALALFVLMIGTWTPASPEVGTVTAGQLRDWAADASSTLHMNAFAGVAGIIALIVLTSALARMTRQAAPQSILGEVVLLGGGLLAVTNAVTVGCTLLWVLPDLGSVDDPTVLTWYSVTWFGQMLGEVAVLAQALILAAFSVAALRNGLMARWLSWLGLVLAAAGAASTFSLLVPSPVFDTLWLVGLYGWSLWPLLAAITLGVRWMRLRRG